MRPTSESERRPPPTRTVPQIDDLHGTPVADPYRWLEAGADTPALRDFIAAQNDHSERFLAAVPEREELRVRLSELWDRPRFGTPFGRSGRTFQFRNSGLQNQDALWLLDDGGRPERVLLDPNRFSADGTAALVATEVSPDGRHLAYAVSGAGSDWRTWRVREVASGTDLQDTLEWSKFSGVAWLPDGAGFYYVGYPAPSAGGRLLDATEAPEIRLHRLGTPQADDELIHRRPDDPRLLLWPDVSHDGARLLILGRRGSSSGTSVQLRRADGEVATLVAEGDAHYTFLGARGDELLFLTDDGAPFGRVVAIDPAQGGHRRTLVPEGGLPIDHARLVGEEVILALLRDATHRLERVDLTTGARREVPLPGPGSLTHPLEQNPLVAERFGDVVHFSFTSFLQPPTPYRLDLAAGTLERLAEVRLEVDPADYETRQLFATSADGTRVPLFVTHRRGLAYHGDSPTLLYGYGGFNVSQLPAFKPERLAWLERGGVYAQACLRGGGEYGAAWHQAGSLDLKQNVFDDFIACAEHLIDVGITSSERLAIQGRSNGGLLVGACLTQRPELFAAALPAVGVLDMLRYHRFTIGWAWISDYGSADCAEQFATLLAYSPLHNLHPGTSYPATLITTGDHDDRVVPAHSFKFAAALQAAQAGNDPILLRVDTRAGHGLGKPTAMLIDEATDQYAFLIETLGVGR